MSELRIGMRLASEDETACPKCQSEDIDRRHHRADSMPECFYWECNECDHQWGHA